MDDETATGSTGERYPRTGAPAEANLTWSRVDSLAAAPPAGHGAANGGFRAAGMDDRVAPGGPPMAEPPLWREAVRHTSGPPDWSDGSSAGWLDAERTPDEPPAAGAVPAQAGPPVAETVPSLASAPPAAAEPSVDGAVPDAYPAGTPQSSAADPGASGGAEQAAAGALPQRVPAEPDVPALDGPAGPPLSEPPLEAEAPELARIADQLRRDDVPAQPTEGFDVEAVLEAVKEVRGVRAASLRTSPTGAHTLRLDLADDADPIEVSRVVARLLQERMGLSASPRYPSASASTTRPAPPHSPWPRPAVDPQRPSSLAQVTEPDREWPAPSDAVSGDHEPHERDRPVPAAGPPPPPALSTGTRVVIDHVQVSIVGLHATVEVRLAAGRYRALGLASGPAIDSYVVRLAAVSAARAIDELMRAAGRSDDDTPSRCHVEHTGVVPFGSTEVAVVVVQLVCGGWVEQLAGSAVVDGDARQAAVRATLGAVNRRLDALLVG